MMNVWRYTKYILKLEAVKWKGEKSQQGPFGLMMLTSYVYVLLQICMVRYQSFGKTHRIMCKTRQVLEVPFHNYSQTPESSLAWYFTGPHDTSIAYVGNIKISFAGYFNLAVRTCLVQNIIKLLSPSIQTPSMKGHLKFSVDFFNVCINKLFWLV